MRYAIIANPASGKIPPERKRSLLREAAGVLDAEIFGLGSRSPDEFNECIVRVSRECDVLVGSGGDGTLSMIVNAIDRSATAVGFLPLGTGNALRHALRLGGSLAAIAHRIRNSPIRRFDLVDCGGRLAFSASVGFDAAVLRERRRHPELRKSGFCSYLFAALIAYFRTYRRVSGILDVDGIQFPLGRLLTLMVVKHPFHGFGMKVVPEARFDDGMLHVLAVSSGFWRSIFWAAASLFFSNRCGSYHVGKNVKAVLDRPCSLQADGEECRQAKEFVFTIMPGAVMMKE